MTNRIKEVSVCRREENRRREGEQNKMLRIILACATGTQKILFCRLGIKSFMDTLHLKLHLRVLAVLVVISLFELCFSLALSLTVLLTFYCIYLI